MLVFLFFTPSQEREKGRRVARLSKGRQQNQSIENMETRDGVFFRQTQIRPVGRRRLPERMEMTSCIRQNVSTIRNSLACGSFQWRFHSRQEAAAKNRIGRVWVRLHFALRVVIRIHSSTRRNILCVLSYGQGNCAIFSSVRLN